MCTSNISTTIPVPIIGGSSYIDLHLKNQLYIVYSSSEIQVERQHQQLPADRHGHKINKYDSRIVKVWECRPTRSYFENPKLSFCSVYRALLFHKNLNSITKLTTDKKQNKRKQPFLGHNCPKKLQIEKNQKLHFFFDKF